MKLFPKSILYLTKACFINISCTCFTKLHTIGQSNTYANII